MADNTIRAMNFDDTDRFAKVLELEVPWAYSYADMTPGKTDRDKREQYREAAKNVQPPPDARWWAFSIAVWKAGHRPFDVDNVGKLIIDAFCRKRIKDDHSLYPQTELYPDDTLDHVRVLLVVGGRGPVDRTKIDVFACISPDWHPTGPISLD